MKASTIIFIIIILVLLYLVIDYMTSSPSLTSMHNAKSAITIGAEKLSSSGNGNNCTHSIWFYISDWNYRYGEPKTVMARMNDDFRGSPAVVLGAIQNDLDISLATYPSEKSHTPQVHTCNVKNVPLQKWVHLLLSVYGRSLDIYLSSFLHHQIWLTSLFQYLPPYLIQKKNHHYQ